MMGGNSQSLSQWPRTHQDCSRATAGMIDVGDIN
jgi:hypothetical protein